MTIEYGTRHSMGEPRPAAVESALASLEGVFFLFGCRTTLKVRVRSKLLE